MGKKGKYVLIILGLFLLTGCSQKETHTKTPIKDKIISTDYSKLSKNDKKDVSVDVVSDKAKEYDVILTHNTNKNFTIDLNNLKLNRTNKFNTNLNTINLSPKNTILIRQLFVLDDKTEKETKNISLYDKPQIKITSDPTEKTKSNFKGKVIYIDEYRRIHYVDAGEPNKKIDVSNLKESDWVKGIPSFLNGTYRSEYVSGEYIMMNFNRSENTWSSYMDPVKQGFGNNFNGFDPSYYHAKEDKNVYFLRDMKTKEPMYMKIIYMGNNTFLRGPIMGELKDDSTNRDTYKYQPDISRGN